jgi:hypothetical protein
MMGQGFATVLCPGAKLGFLADGGKQRGAAWA